MGLQQQLQQLELRNAQNREMRAHQLQGLPSPSVSGESQTGSQEATSETESPQPQTQPPATWGCARCTYLNPIQNEFCEMCDTKRVIPPKKSSEEPEKFAGYW